MITFHFQGNINEFRQIFDLLTPLGESSAIINQLHINQEAIMAAFETLDSKLTEATTAILNEAQQAKTILDELAALSASDRITPEQLSSLSSRFDAVINGIKGIVPDAPVEPPVPA